MKTKQLLAPQPPALSVNVSTRLPHDVAVRLFAIAEKRGVKVSTLARELLTDCATGVRR